MKMKWNRAGLLAAVVVLLLVALAGCGKPKADVSIFMMFPQNVSFNKQDELKAALQPRIGESPTVTFAISPFFEPQKMIVELAAGGHGVFVLPKEQFDVFKGEEGLVPLDDILKKEDFPGGVQDGKLLGVPLKDSKLLKEAGYNGGEMYAFITERVKNKDQAKQVLKVMAQR